MISIKEKWKDIQRGVGAYPDGSPGPQTIDCVYRMFATPVLPYAIKLYNQWAFFADPKEVNPFDPNGKSARRFKNFVSGSFSWKGEPISILVSNGKTICSHSCHYWITDRQGKPLPETVLWYNKDGTYGTSQVAFDHELPDRANILWAIGGAGLLPGDALEEGFSGVYADVFRYTTHILIGMDTFGYFTAVYVDKMSGAQIKKLAKKLMLTHYTLLDGGHVTSVNVDGVRKNIDQAQYYGIQLGGE